MRRVCFCLCCFGVTDANYGHMRTPTAESWNHPKITIRPWAVFSMVKRLDYKRKYVDIKRVVSLGGELQNRRHWSRTSHAFSYSSQASTDDWLIIGCLVCVWDGFVWASFLHFWAFRCSVSIHVGRCAGLGVGGWASGGRVVRVVFFSFVPFCLAAVLFFRSLCLVALGQWFRLCAVLCLCFGTLWVFGFGVADLDVVLRDLGVLVLSLALRSRSPYTRLD